MSGYAQTAKYWRGSFGSAARNGKVVSRNNTTQVGMEKLNMKKHRPLNVILLLVLTGLLGPVQTQAEILVSGAYARASMSGAANSAAYMRLENNADIDVVIIGAESARIPRMAMHTQDLSGGMAAMRPLQSALVKAHGSLEFKPGGHHFMLMGIEKPLVVGEIFPVTLKFENGQTQMLTMVVKPVTEYVMPMGTMRH